MNLLLREKLPDSRIALHAETYLGEPCIAEQGVSMCRQLLHWDLSHRQTHQGQHLNISVYHYRQAGGRYALWPHDNVHMNSMPGEQFRMVLAMFFPQQHHLERYLAKCLDHYTEHIRASRFSLPK